MKKSKFACRWTLFMIYEKSKYLIKIGEEVRKTAIHYEIQML